MADELRDRYGVDRDTGIHALVEGWRVARSGCLVINKRRYFNERLKAYEGRRLRVRVVDHLATEYEVFYDGSLSFTAHAAGPVKGAT